MAKKRRILVILISVLVVLFFVLAVEFVIQLPVPSMSQIQSVKVAPAGNSHQPSFTDKNTIKKVLSGCFWSLPIGQKKPNDFGEHIVYAVDFCTADRNQTIYVTSKGLVDVIAVEYNGVLSYWITYPWYDSQLKNLP